MGTLMLYIIGAVLVTTIFSLAVDVDQFAGKTFKWLGGNA